MFVPLWWSWLLTYSSLLCSMHSESGLLDLTFFFCFLAFMTNCHIWVPLSQGLWLPFIPNSSKLVGKCLRYNSQCYIHSIHPHSGSIRVQNASLDKKRTSGLNVFFCFLAFMTNCHIEHPVIQQRLVKWLK